MIFKLELFVDYTIVDIRESTVLFNNDFKYFVLINCLYSWLMLKKIIFQDFFLNLYYYNPATRNFYVLLLKREGWGTYGILWHLFFGYTVKTHIPLKTWFSDSRNFIRKTLMEGIPPIGPGSTGGQLALSLQTKQNPGTSKICKTTNNSVLKIWPQNNAFSIIYGLKNVKYYLTVLYYVDTVSLVMDTEMPTPTDYP